MKISKSFMPFLALGSAFAGEKSVSEFSSSRSPSAGWSLSNVSVGAAWRSFGFLDYRGGSRSQNFLIPSQVGGDSLSLPSIGTTGDIGDRTYHNGFVNVDSSTDINGDTWYWGYDSSDQVSGNTLNFSATGARSAYSESANFSGNVSDDDRLENFSPQVDFLLRPPGATNLPFDGVLISFWYAGDNSTHQFSNFSATQNREDFRLDFIDQYDISSITPLVGEGYQGSFTGPGPIISNQPLNRERVDVPIGGENATFSNSISTSLDLDNYSLAIGPTLSGRFSDQWSWQASAGITLNVFQWSARETETLNASLNGATPAVFQQWNRSNSGTDFRVGAYIRGDIAKQITEDWFAKAYLSGEIADSIKMKVGESEYEYQPQGYAVGLSIGRRF